MAKYRNCSKGKRKNGCLLEVCRPSARSTINLSRHVSQPGSCLPSLSPNMPQSPPAATILLPEKNSPRCGKLACGGLWKQCAKCLLAEPARLLSHIYSPETERMRFPSPSSSLSPSCRLLQGGGILVHNPAELAQGESWLRK